TPDPPTPDPRVSFPTPFRNVKPDVRYVGDGSCAGCHAAIDKSYHAHPMGRSAGLVSRATPIESFGETAHTSFTTGGFQLRVEKTADGMVHRVGARNPAGAALPEYVTTADITVGSGTRGRSYLTVQQGAIWQTPVSWFTAAARWDLSPGFTAGTGDRRAVLPECLFCHVDRVDPVPGARNRYREPVFPGQVAIGCERCHGPGELHVAERTAGGVREEMDTSIVNPKHLSAELRAAVCEQCHLQGEERVTRRGRALSEFRPGLPFEQFVTVFVRLPDLAEANRSVGQFEQMERSRCFAGSGGRLGCTSCHNPHEVPAAADRDRVYRGRCLTCHESKGCSLPAPDRQAKGDSCIACHMPRTGSANITHASVTDHRVPRVPTPPVGPRSLDPAAIPLVAFRTGPHSPPEAERARDLGIALARSAIKIPRTETAKRNAVGLFATTRLTASLQTWRGDAPAWTGLGFARTARGETEARLEAATAAAGLAPDSEIVLGELADAAAAAGRFDVSVETATRLIGMTPTAVEPLHARATALARLREWDRAEEDCRAALRIHPLHPQVRLLFAVCRHHRGDPAGGRREADTAARLTTSPQQRAALLDRYQHETR
ncbi:MAG: hypothetical protein JWO38_2521, partial [Gemmataceae bacterium]|nr:hypothetical protein [Gemmataceae bacterium]